MPEGDVVWRTCRRLHHALAGRCLTGTDFRVPGLATTDLTGRSVREVVARGKHQLLRVDGGLTLHTHLRMDGAWHLYPSGARRRGGPGWQVRVVLAVEGCEAVGYRLPVVELIATAAEAAVLGHLGPDLLGPQWDGAAAAEAAARLGADAHRGIGEALLDQRNLAGIGTFYRAEVLFLAGVHPRRPVGEVADVTGLVDRARRLLLANRDRVEQVSTGDTRTGRRAYVFQRARRPCRRCATPIRTERFGPPGQERRSYWCPSCQV